MQLTYDQICRALDFVAENDRLRSEHSALTLENARLTAAVEALLHGLRNAHEQSERPCAHPDHVVNADVLEGCGGGYAVAHCTTCGAVRVSYEDSKGRGNVSPWRRPTNKLVDTADRTATAGATYATSSDSTARHSTETADEKDE